MNDLLALTSTVITSAGSLLELAKNIRNSELQKQIAELNVQVAKVQNEIALLIRENDKLTDELVRIKNDKANPLTFNTEDGLYYDTGNNAPYCPHCYEARRERIHLAQFSLICPECHEPFREKGFAAAVAVSRPQSSRFKI